MRILFLTDNFPPESNAPARRTHEHARHWVRRGCEVTVLTGAPNFPEGLVYPGYRNRWRAREEIDGIRVVRVKTFITANEGVLLRSLDYASFMVSAVAAGLFLPRPDVVVATSPQFFAALGGWLLAALRRRPFVFELRDLWPASIVAVGAMRRGLAIRLLERVEMFLYRRAAAIVAVTEAYRAELAARGVAPEKIFVVPGGVEAGAFAPRPRDGELAARLGLEEKFVIGYIGTLGLAHALERVLDAAERLAAHPAIVFLLVGGGAARAGLEAEARRRGLANVVVLGRQEGHAMPRVWSLCDVALVHLKDSPLFASVVPSKMFEAMAMGLPILLCAPEGEAACLLRRHRLGLACPAERPGALADAALALAGDEARRRAFARASRRAAAEFSRERLAGVMLDLLERVASDSGRASAAPAAPRRG